MAPVVEPMPPARPYWMTVRHPIDMTSIFVIARYFEYHDIVVGMRPNTSRFTIGRIQGLSVDYKATRVLIEKGGGGKNARPNRRPLPIMCRQRSLTTSANRLMAIL